MKPSDIEKEIEIVKRNPKLLLLSLIFILLIFFTGFYFSKYLSGDLSPECKSPRYNLAKTEVCGALEYNALSGKQCGVANYKRCKSGGACGYKGPGKTNANKCRHEICGVESYNVCSHKEFGVAKFKSCRHESHGLEICEDSPPWMFWKK